MPIGGPENQIHAGKIDKLLRVAWSKERAYHGDDVTISVTAENVPDGKAVTVQVLPEGSEAATDTIDAGSLDKGKVSKVYKIDWKNKPCPPGVMAYRLKATVDKVDSELSPPLWVDLVLPLLSA